MSYFSEPVLDGLWVSQSSNDGRRWTAAVPILHRDAATGPSAGGQFITDSYYFHGLSAVRTPSDMTLVAIEHHIAITGVGVGDFWDHPSEAGSRASLAMLDYQAVGVSQALGGDVIFRGVHAR